MPTASGKRQIENRLVMRDRSQGQSAPEGPLAPRPCLSLRVFGPLPAEKPSALVPQRAASSPTPRAPRKAPMRHGYERRHFPPESAMRYAPIIHKAENLAGARRRVLRL